MPLDGHAYLVAQGWEGRGSGLRKGAIAKPVAVIQKKTLSGVGKDRDDAFPFWDHVFSAAASAIKIKTTDSDDESDDTDTPDGLPLQRTTTGIISNRRPATGTPALLSSSSSGSTTPRVSVMAAAKQEAARRTLYAMFFRGPVMRSDDPTPTSTPTPTAAKGKEAVDDVLEKVTGRLEKERRRKDKGKARVVESEDEEQSEISSKKRRSKNREQDAESAGTKEKREHKRRKMGNESHDVVEEAVSLSVDKAAEKAERKKRREEKRARKEEKRSRKLAKVVEAAGEETKARSTDILPVVTNTEESHNLTKTVAEELPGPELRKKKRKKSPDS
ncbi:hypothetical protein EUX98_g6618 [Antrodiella citrinella]|uniref:G-patch domain-containing protein n=1 Tax=Antrodiella citrinella TaxID=2447956 RepID=A0A4S4MQD3_9APHY|nr:hypothetical protein EUX98_g6618 [Antrodiella citrinella]